MAVKLEFLGTGNAFLPQGRYHSLLLIDESILIDCPPTALASLRRRELSPKHIKSILFTHWHGDHYFGIPFLILERKWISDRSGESDLAIHGPKGCRIRVSQLCETAYPGSMTDRLDSLEWNEEEKGVVGNSPEWQFERFKVEHDEEVDPHGYLLIHESGLQIMHTGDSGPCEAISSRVPQCDVVVIEMGVPDEVDVSMHFKPSTLDELARANPDTKFLVTHTWLDDPRSNKTPILSAELPSLSDNVIQVGDGDGFILDSDGLNST